MLNSLDISVYSSILKINSWFSQEISNLTENQLHHQKQKVHRELGSTLVLISTSLFKSYSLLFDSEGWTRVASEVIFQNSFQYYFKIRNPKMGKVRQGYYTPFYTWEVKLKCKSSQVGTVKFFCCLYTFLSVILAAFNHLGRRKKYHKARGWWRFPRKPFGAE